ncbi:phage antirepressor [Riemerella anatipestifer]|uniref:BRO-N domain-containing protein n=1 Tax=Riemerella anatipestifer TaxID=34085 RepID=UPI00129D5247|nr:Bro-N domain-containing protein [Riemerella anatipestifer]MRM97712.1 phage antirepressor [Riemerella anatipestifer]MRN01701.1 phage antirepressor [Riemerella anatipestifer]MRN03785.1 phage antirepressor [Riemerella anatipestifer]
MSNIITHPQFGEIRMKTKAGEPWFCAKDVCAVLGIIWKGSDSFGSLDDDEKGVEKTYTPGGYQNLLYVNESGLYTLIMRSNKPEARKFRKWVTSEVLPAIRKYGTYSTDPKIMNRAKARAEQKVVREMLSEVGSHLSRTDIKLVAKQCRTTEWQVEKVLRGDIKDTYMLQLLYARSTGNKVLESQFYTASGAQKLMNELKNR